MGIALYDHQIDAKERIHNGSVLKGDVGSGKSITGLAYFFQEVCGGNLDAMGAGLPKPRDIYVITTAKKRDKLEWEEEALPFHITVDRDTSISGIKLHVDSWNNIAQYIDVENAFFIFDEQRLVGSGSWVKSFLKIAKNNEWIMLSATPGDQWMDYAPLFIANGFYKNKTEFLREHAVYSRYSRYPKIDRWINRGRLVQHRERILVEMPDVRHTVRHVRPFEVSFDKDQFRRAVEERWHVYEDRPIRDFTELCAVLRRIVNSDARRLEAVRTILGDHPRLIVFYNFNYELEMLRQLGGPPWVTEEPYPEIREWNGHKHEPLPEGERWIYLVQYAAGAEGWNCTTTDTVVFYSLNYSYRINEQGKGRIDRINTPYTDLFYYVIQSNSFIDKAILKTLALKRNFNKKDEEQLAKEVNFVSSEEGHKNYS